MAEDTLTGDAGSQNPKQTLSRRAFLKLTAWGAGALAIAAVGGKAILDGLGRWGIPTPWYRKGQITSLSYDVRVSARIVLIDPKFPHNVGGAYRAAACFGGEAVYVIGDRVSLQPYDGYRLPREERLRSYRQEVDLIALDGLDGVIGTSVPVAVEVNPTAEQLHHFEHPPDALYMFGPEDGWIPKGWRTMCHRFVVIPSYHSLNLAAAVYTVLYDRVAKRRLAGIDSDVPSAELMSHGRKGYAEHSPQ